MELNRGVVKSVEKSADFFRALTIKINTCLSYLKKIVLSIANAY